MEFASLVVVINAIFEIIFFISIGVITFLTYRSAKKTILQPIKTEIFKVQIEVLTNILRFFAGKGEIELRNQFDFDNLIRVNAIQLLDDYAELFFDIEVEYQKQPYSNEHCRVKIVQEEFLELYNSPEMLSMKKKQKDIPSPDPRVKAAIWEKHKYSTIHLPNKHSEIVNEYKKILSSPLIPKECVSLLESYLERIDKNVLLINRTLTEVAKELPIKYPSMGTLEKASLAWISNAYMEKFLPLEPIASNIINFIREYWSTDELMSSEK